MTASRLHCALVSIASVATTAMVVFAPGGSPFSGGRAGSGGNGCGRPSPPNSPSCSKGAAQKCGPSPRLVAPQAFTATIAPTVCPDAETIEAEPSPPFSVAVVAPVPAPTVPSANSVPAAFAAA